MPDSRSDAVDRAWQYLADRFGVEQDAAVLDGLTLVAVADDVWLASADYDVLYEVKTYGIRCIRVQDVGLKPTTYALQVLEPAVSRNVVTVDRQQLLALLDGELVAVDAISGEPDDEGYIGIRYDGRMIGCGLYKNGTVSSRVPKGRGQELAAALEEKKAEE